MGIQFLLFKNMLTYAHMHTHTHTHTSIYPQAMMPRSEPSHTHTHTHTLKHTDTATDTFIFINSVFFMNSKHSLKCTHTQTLLLRRRQHTPTHVHSYSSVHSLLITTYLNTIHTTHTYTHTHTHPTELTNYVMKL